MYHDVGSAELKCVDPNKRDKKEKNFPDIHLFVCIECWIYTVL